MTLHEIDIAQREGLRVARLFNPFLPDLTGRDDQFPWLIPNGDGTFRYDPNWRRG